MDMSCKRVGDVGKVATESIGGDCGVPGADHSGRTYSGHYHNPLQLFNTFQQGPHSAVLTGW